MPFQYVNQSKSTSVDAETLKVAHRSDFLFARDLVNITGSISQSIYVVGLNDVADCCDGKFVWDPSSVHDGVFTFGRWTRLWDHETIDARWFGLKADGKTVWDVSTVAGSFGITSSNANFTQADVGKEVLLNAPSELVPGTCNLSTTLVYATGNNTNWLTSLAGQSAACWINGENFPVYVVSDTQIILNRFPKTNAISTSLYRQCQISGSIVSVEDSSHATLSFSSSLSLSGLKAVYGTRQTNAFSSSIAYALRNKIPKVKLPKGDIIVGESITFKGTDYTIHSGSIEIFGAGARSTTIVDMRPASEGHTYDRKLNLHFQYLNGVHIHDLGFDGCIPTLSMISSYGRNAAYFNECSNVIVESVCIRTGSRDESLIFDTAYVNDRENFTFRDIHYDWWTNSNAINANSGYLRSVIIEDCHIKAAQSAIAVAAHDAIVTGNTLEGTTMGASLVQMDVTGKLDYGRNKHMNVVHTAGVGVLDVFTGVRADYQTGSVIHIHDNEFFDMMGTAAALDNDAVVCIDNFLGSCMINDNIFNNVKTAAGYTDGGKYVGIGLKGYVATGSILVCNNIFNARPGDNMTIGVKVGANCDPGIVTIRDNLCSKYVREYELTGSVAQGTPSGGVLCTDLVNLTGSVSQSIIAVGRDKIFDGGEGQFVWNPTSTHDGGIVFGHWQRIVEDGRINVQWYGIHPDAEASYNSDTIDMLLTASLPSAGNSGSLHLFFPQEQNSYRICRPIVIPKRNAENYVVKMTGDGVPHCKTPQGSYHDPNWRLRDIYIGSAIQNVSGSDVWDQSYHGDDVNLFSELYLENIAGYTSGSGIVLNNGGDHADDAISGCQLNHVCLGGGKIGWKFYSYLARRHSDVRMNGNQTGSLIVGGAANVIHGFEIQSSGGQCGFAISGCLGNIGWHGGIIQGIGGTCYQVLPTTGILGLTFSDVYHESYGLGISDHPTNFGRSTNVKFEELTWHGETIDVNTATLYGVGWYFDGGFNDFYFTLSGTATFHNTKPQIVQLDVSNGYRTLSSAGLTINNIGLASAGVQSGSYLNTDTVIHGTNIQRLVFAPTMSINPPTNASYGDTGIMFFLNSPSESCEVVLNGWGLGLERALDNSTKGPSKTATLMWVRNSYGGTYGQQFHVVSWTGWR